MKMVHTIHIIITCALLLVVIVLFKKISSLENSKTQTTFSKIVLHSEDHPNSSVTIDGGGISIEKTNKLSKDNAASYVFTLTPFGWVATRQSTSKDDEEEIVGGGMLGREEKPLLFMGDGVKMNSDGRASCPSKVCNAINLSMNPPSISMYHNLHLRTVLGVTYLTSQKLGGSVTTPMSSIVLFDKKGNVVTKLPFGE